LYPTQLSLLELKGAFFLTARSFDGLQVQPNRYLSDLSSSSEESSGRRRATRGEKIRRKFHRRMEFFLAEGGSCSYDAESIDDIEVPLRYKHLVKRWVPKDLPQVNTDFCLDERIYRIAPSSLHGLGLFSMDGIKVFDGGITELMEYVGPCYNYRDWMKLVQYTRGMRIYGVAANYIQLRDNDRNKGGSMYIDGRPKASGNIVGFINST
jgi:hypothetical protein